VRWFTRRWRLRANRSGSTWRGARRRLIGRAWRRPASPASDILTEDALHNAMVVHAAFGGSTNLLLHIPPSPMPPGCRMPTVADWAAINRSTPRLVDVLPNGPVGHPTVRVFLAGGVPEVMLHLRRPEVCCASDALTVARPAAGARCWMIVGRHSERRRRLRERICWKTDGSRPRRRDHGAGARAKQRGLTSTVTFPGGQSGAGGVSRQEHAIDPSVHRCRRRLSQTGPARVFTSAKGRNRCHQGANAAAGAPRRHHCADGARAVSAVAWRKPTR
jgi:dihydroxyacid dehydratase/phosphogluconate dehydratase